MQTQIQLNAPKAKINRDQLITNGDLEDFKIDLLDNFVKILHEHSHIHAKEWLKSSEVRELLDISPGTLQNLRVNGTLPYTKIGGVIYYQLKDIDQMLQDHKIHNK